MTEDVRAALAADRTIDITTIGRKTGRPRRLEMWFHNVEGRIFITGLPGTRSWYANMGHRVLEVTEEAIVAEGGFTSEHFTEDRLRQILGPCTLHAIGDIAYLARC